MTTLAQPSPKEQARLIVERYEELEARIDAPLIDLDELPEQSRAEARAILADIELVIKANPLHAFKAHEPNQHGLRPQLEFLAAVTKIVAAFAGNRFGKTVALIVKVLVQALDDDDVPEHLKPFKQLEAPCHGWVFCPKEEKIFDSLKPTVEKWCPKSALKGGSWAKAFNGERKMLTFSNGSTVSFKTYQEDPSGLGGADLDFVAYDEPPPKAHRNEAIMRMARGVREWYAMTPVRVNVAWIHREIHKKRESPDITVVKGSIHENSTLSEEAVAFILDSYPDTERSSREYGDFMDLSGLVYKAFSTVVVPARPRAFVHTLEHVVGIDPGIRNAAFVFGGFDQHGVDWIYDELMIQDGTPADYAAGIDAKLKQWGLRRDHVMFVVDPAARQRSQATGDTVQSELTREGIHTTPGVRDREAGQQQIRSRIQHDRLQVFDTCVGLINDAEEFAYPLADEGVVVIGPADDSPFHRLATLRYQVMTRPWYPQMDDDEMDRDLGWVPGFAPPAGALRLPQPVGPLGPLS